MEIPIIRMSEHPQEQKCMNFAFSAFPDQHPQMPHRHKFYQIILLETGKARHTLDFETYEMEAPAASVVFPDQIETLEFSDDARGVCVLFDETIFCSAVLANDLKAYNIDLHKKINNLEFASRKDSFNELLELYASMLRLYKNINPLRKMQIKFMVKIMLLKLIDSSTVENLSPATDKDLQCYIRFRELLDLHYKKERKLAFYTEELGVSVKKLTSLCNHYSGIPPLSLIHNKLTLEIKKRFASQDVTLKELAFEFGFSSQAALNKYIYTKFSKTPTELRDLVLQKMNGKS